MYENQTYPIIHHGDYMSYQTKSTPHVEKLYTVKRRLLYVKFNNDNTCKINRNFSGIMAIHYLGFIDNGTASLPPVVRLEYLINNTEEQHFLVSTVNTENDSHTLYLPTKPVLTEKFLCAYFEKVDGKITNKSVQVQGIDGSEVNLDGYLIFELEIGREV